MVIEIKIPSVGESITEVEIAAWKKQVGDRVTQDETVLEIESEKAAMEVPAPADGVLVEITQNVGNQVDVGAVVGRIDTEAAGVASESDSAASQDSPADAPTSITEAAAEQPGTAETEETRIMPAAQRLLDEHALEPDAVRATGPGGRLLKEDVLAHLEGDIGDGGDDRESETVRMSPLRRTVARRLVEAQHEMAMLTTFNEVDLSAVQKLRAEVKAQFQEKHEVKLGLMSFFVKATIQALKAIPGLNAEVRGDDLIYHRFYDIGVAIGGGKGLVVPPIRNAECLSFAEIEKTIADFAQRARSRRLKPEELEGGTFTISNGGIYGSLMSTPIVNPPQTGILGLHTIQDRPVAVDGEIVIRPMMNVALSYDHRVVDGREAVTFLRSIKEMIEMPAKILLEL